jgi:hypothetical protein
VEVELVGQDQKEPVQLGQVVVELAVLENEEQQMILTQCLL